MQLITVFSWIIGVIVMKSTTIVVCKMKQEQQQKQQHKFLVQSDNRILSSGFPEFLLEFQRNSINKNNNYNNKDQNIGGYISNSEKINGLNNNVNKINIEDNYKKNGDTKVIIDDPGKNHKFKFIDNNFDNVNVEGDIDNYDNRISIDTMRTSYNGNNHNKNHFNNLNDNISICKNTLKQALADYDDLEQIFKKSDLQNSNFDLEELMNTSEITQINEKRGNVANGPGCDCQIKNDLIDLGYPHYPRYLFNAVCQDSIGNPSMGSSDEHKTHSKRCWRGSQCKPVEYKVRVLTYRTRADNMEKDYTMSLLPDVLRSDWKWKTVTVAAGCFCSY
ncbi:probable serine/threonine-protein kinase dyrk1 [Condylostylus longicornis]|uniref:probable serine/threonine-protein kinase dyrk1 n=1 Tax=Condylostylus longicornis TaxID=2530218 RepID=UPI00244E1E96|nr:probable serine/threonine-protein kinase dyrk1 [Condylostylus longicornis]